MSMKATINKQDKTITIVMPLTDGLPPSASGKTLQVASSHGNQPTALQVDGKPVIIGCNAYVKA